MKKTTKKITAPSAKTKASAKKTSAPAKKKRAEPPATFISAKSDIGFGNHLYLRGEGPGLSWDHGIAMDCVGTGLWTATVKNATSPVTFKLLEPGVLVVTRRSNAPLVLVGAQFGLAWRLRSWDRFYIPWPFSRIRMRCTVLQPIGPDGDKLSAEQVGAELRAINPD